MNALRLLRGLLLAGALVGGLAPEVRRYRAERLLRVGTEALRQLVGHPREVADPQGALSRIRDIALSAAAGLPGDSRPWILAGSTRLVAAEPSRALELYHEAFDRGERAEIDVNMGGALEAQGEFAKSRAAFLRAVWISPALLSALLPDIANELAPKLQGLEADLHAGRLKAPPPPP